MNECELCYRQFEEQPHMLRNPLTDTTLEVCTCCWLGDDEPIAYTETGKPIYLAGVDQA